LFVGQSVVADERPEVVDEACEAASQLQGEVFDSLESVGSLRDECRSLKTDADYYRGACVSLGASSSALSYGDMKIQNYNRDFTNATTLWNAAMDRAAKGNSAMTDGHCSEIARNWAGAVIAYDKASGFFRESLRFYNDSTVYGGAIGAHDSAREEIDSACEFFCALYDELCSGEDDYEEFE
jgi:hypothetical protein